MNSQQRKEILDSMYPDTPGFLFSERVAIEKEFMGYCLASGSANCSSNFLVWLTKPGNNYGKTVITKLFNEASR